MPCRNGCRSRFSETRVHAPEMELELHFSLLQQKLLLQQPNWQQRRLYQPLSAERPGQEFSWGVR